MPSATWKIPCGHGTTAIGSISSGRMAVSVRFGTGGSSNELSMLGVLAGKLGSNESYNRLRAQRGVWSVQQGQYASSDGNWSNQQRWSVRGHLVHLLLDASAGEVHIWNDADQVIAREGLPRGKELTIAVGRYDNTAEVLHAWRSPAPVDDASNG